MEFNLGRRNLSKQPHLKNGRKLQLNWTGKILQSLFVIKDFFNFRLKGFEEWKLNPVSNDFDYELIQTRLEQFRVAREIGDLDAISFLLRASMTRGLGDVGNLELYSQSYTGTKKLIEEFNEELILSLEFIYQNLPEDNRVARRSKYEFFRGLRHMLGNTALLLSGGGALGTHHIGVLNALNDAGILPRIISGSSSGSIMAAMICTRTDDELAALNTLEGLNMNFLDEPSVGPGFQQYWIKLRRLMQEGVIFDQNVLRTCLRENIGHVTFLEAFKKSRRILNVSVSSSTRHEMPRMLNYLTAPNVLIWSAVLASCAVPGVFYSSGLLAKDPRSGALIPWHPGDDIRWIDGSVENDIPRARLAELFNVNHFIVSQVNPHVYPFLERKRREPGPPSRMTHLIRMIIFLIHSELCFRLHQLISLNIFFPNLLHRLLSFLTQKYDGDITIIPDLSLTDIKLLFADPSREQIKSSVIRGARATWPLISIIWNQCRVELLLDQLLSKMKRKSSNYNNSGSNSRNNSSIRRRYNNEGSASVSTLSTTTSMSQSPSGSKRHFRRSSSPLVYQNLETSISFDELGKN